MSKEPIVGKPHQTGLRLLSPDDLKFLQKHEFGKFFSSHEGILWPLASYYYICKKYDLGDPTIDILRSIASAQLETMGISDHVDGLAGRLQDVDDEAVRRVFAKTLVQEIIVRNVFSEIDNAFSKRVEAA